MTATAVATTTTTPSFFSIIYRWFQILRKPKQDLIAQHYRVLAEEQRGISTAGAPDLQNLLPYARTLEEEQRPPYPLDGPSIGICIGGNSLINVCWNICYWMELCVQGIGGGRR
ncbi:hypothetical protein BDD12DRAFT_562185 [Trichophaea hybrida]|nr:hypothetical protein BDD12DRAFT_562185 [Trichophaea hybrida]